MTKALRAMVLMCLAALLAFSHGGICARAEAGSPCTEIPQIDSSTARIPITDALYALLRDKYQLSGPEPMCSKTHGAWLNLADSKADILFTVAPTADEFQYFRDRGVQIEMKVYGYDGLVFLGNEDNPVQSLTGDDIRAIYSGQITNWWDVSYLVDAPIEVYIRNAESGSQRLFEQLVWADRDMPDFSKLGFREGEIDPVITPYKVSWFDEMSGITESVMENKFAIGFNIMSYIDSEYLSPQGATDEEKWSILATGDVNLRSGPGLSYASLGILKEGEQLPFLDESEDDERGVTWYKAQHATHGPVWVSSKYGIKERMFSSKLKLFKIDDFEPSTENFASGDYPFVTTSIVAIRADEPEDSPARQLFNWIGSEESSALIADNSTLAVSFSDPFIYDGVDGQKAQ